MFRMASRLYIALMSAGVVQISFDPSRDVNESLSIVSASKAGVQTGFLAAYDNNIYAISRTSFPDNSTRSGGVFSFQEETVQVVLKQSSCKLPWTEQAISETTSRDFLQWFQHVQASRVSKDIVENISSIPPFRLNAFMAPDQRIVVLSIHHSIYDGISLPIMLQAVDHLYEGVALAETCPLSEALAYVYHADLEKAKNFWTKYLENYDWARSEITSVKPKALEKVTITFDLPISELYRKSAECNCTAQTLLTASYAVALDQHLYHSQDIVFGVS